MLDEMINNIYNFLSDKKILILGYGIEGKSTYNFIRNRFKYLKLTILDYNIVEDFGDENVEIFCDNDYEKYFKDFDIIIKSQGVSIKNEVYTKYSDKITSQTSMFLEYSKNTIIGVTGTKGKSTTTSLIYHVLKNNGVDTILVGNIGIPVLSELSNINDSTVIVFEMSSHQLQHTSKSPKIAILLNIYEEHLDYYESFKDYILAKENVYKFQNKNDLVIYNSDCDNIDINKIIKIGQRRIAVYNSRNNIQEDNYINIQEDDIVFKFNNKITTINKKDVQTKLIGEHNLYNISVVIAVSNEMGINIEDTLKSIASFNGLEHRLEYVGKYNDIIFYNDSIATIPEATICAIKSFNHVDTVIIGGKDRGINYMELVEFLKKSSISKVLLIAASGKRIYDLLDKNDDKYIYVESLENAVEIAKLHTPKNGICLLSPAAASYGYYKNFEERGNAFKELILK